MKFGLKYNILWFEIIWMWNEMILRWIFEVKIRMGWIFKIEWFEMWEVSFEIYSNEWFWREIWYECFKLMKRDGKLHYWTVV